MQYIVICMERNERNRRFIPGKETRYPFIGGWVPGTVWRVRKILSPPGFDPRIVHPLASRYTDYAVPAHSKLRMFYKNLTVIWAVRYNTYCYFSRAPANQPTGGGGGGGSRVGDGWVNDAAASQSRGVDAAPACSAVRETPWVREHWNGMWVLSDRIPFWLTAVLWIPVMRSRSDFISNYGGGGRLSTCGCPGLLYTPLPQVV
jgi:hypothetical protein